MSDAKRRKLDSGLNNRNGPNNDPRFAVLQNDPRYRLPSRKQTRIKLDSRFAHVLKDSRFTQKAQVDRYGRPLSDTAGRKELERFYRLDEDRDVDDDDEVERELKRVEARGDEGYDPARQGGFQESSSSEDESSDEEEEDVEEQSHLSEGKEKDEVSTNDVTRRLAAVNMDWDNIRAVDLMAVAESFCPSGGKIEDVTVYPSEYGRERMEREQMEGPAKEHFADGQLRQREAVQSSIDQVDPPPDDDEAGNEINSKAFRKYQLTRLRYYYAVLICSSAATARAIYDSMDGREYLSSANFFDLRFVPDSVTFDDPITDKPRDRCESIPKGYKPNEFVTEALTHSKVKLTWDAEDKGRKQAQKRAFSSADAAQDDLRAYVGSDTSDSGSEQESRNLSAAQDGSLKLSAKEQARRKTRALLGLGPSSPSAASKSVEKPSEGDMQITFSAGLSKGPNGSSIFANKPEDVHEETSREKYIRKERERKVRRRERAKATRTGTAVDQDAKTEPIHTAQNDADQASSGSEEDFIPLESPAEEEVDDARDPFNDPFFTDPAAENTRLQKEARKAKNRRNREATEKEAAEKAEEREKLRKLMADSPNDRGSASLSEAHFDMAAIKRQEKDEKRKGKKGKKKRHHPDEDEEQEKRQDDFAPNLADERFKDLFSRSDYAIDPTNPRFSGTKTMNKILAASREKREQDTELATATAKKKQPEPASNDVNALVSKIKAR